MINLSNVIIFKYLYQQGNTTYKSHKILLFLFYMACVFLYNTSEMHRIKGQYAVWDLLSIHSITYKETQFLYLVFWGKDLYLNPKIQLISSIFDIPVPNLWYAKMFCSFDEGHVVLHPAGTWVGILIPVSCQPMIILSMVSAGILPITAAAAHQHATNVECCDISTFILHSQPNILT